MFLGYVVISDLYLFHEVFLKNTYFKKFNAIVYR